ncbi:MAG: hypothetical protein ACXVDB_08990 [Tumebacillaceae bacterium]
MAHFLRVFTSTTDTPTLPVLANKLDMEGFDFNTFPKKDDPRFLENDWRTLHISYDERAASVILDRSLKGEEDKLFEEEIEEFQQSLAALEDSSGKQTVAALLANTQQVFACLIPDDITEHGWELVETLLEIVLDHTGGTLQVDGEGWYDKEGELILEME